MAEGKKGFILYADQKELFDQLPDDKAGNLIKHIFKYVNDENPKSDDLIINLAFTSIKQQLKRDLKKYEIMKENPVSREIAEELLKRLLPYINVNDWGATVAVLQVQLGKFNEGEIIGNYNYQLRNLKKGDLVECAHTNAKTLTIGKKYELLDTWISEMGNKWCGRIKNDISCKIMITETRRFIRG